jgi:hypothetical protein
MKRLIAALALAGCTPNYPANVELQCATRGGILSYHPAGMGITITCKDNEVFHKGDTHLCDAHGGVASRADIAETHSDVFCHDGTTIMMWSNER